ncbi:MAG: DUF4194 domain-containing protein [Bacteroides sp.]|jgi:hypothetical protein|nr:DUF4194 domain-containing protein [Bacteroides sp.]MCI7181319.1 DUF4194 domain-containing protein [Lachnospiraceae bacterium]MCI7359225.1 DUF4194 domain-containing protein [Parabacteroides sp.]MDD6909360.1 DUF4194 domain-containing protein [Bacteroidaceae bacterium]
MNISNIKPYSKAIVKLLKGIVEYNDPVWNNILIYQSDIQNYLSVIGLNLIVKKDEGFAFVKQAVLDDEKTLNLVTRRQLGFEVSVILIILRQMLEDFEMNPTDSQADEKYVTPSQIKDEVELFLPSRFNQIKFKQDLDNYISKVIDLGFLVASKQTDTGTETRYKIHRIIKEKITLDALNDFKNKLNDYDTTDESI